MIRLNDTVQVMVMQSGSAVRATGKVVGRTFESEPHYDIRLPSGQIEANVEGERIVRKQ